jgi:hypothetical protein
MPPVKPLNNPPQRKPNYHRPQNTTPLPSFKSSKAQAIKLPGCVPTVHGSDLTDLIQDRKTEAYK